MAEQSIGQRLMDLATRSLSSVFPGAVAAVVCFYFLGPITTITDGADGVRSIARYNVVHLGAPALVVSSANASDRAQVEALEGITPPEARRVSVVLPRRWVVERDFARACRFRRLVRNDERPPETAAGLHVVAVLCLTLHRSITLAAQRP